MMPPKKLAKLRDAKPEDLSSEYDSMQVSAHKDAVSLFERYANGGDDPKLKDWAGKTLPALKHHLEMAQAARQEPEVNARRAGMNQRAFLVASQSSVQLTLAAVITGHPTKNPAQGRAFCNSAALAALFRVLVLVLLTWLLAGVLTLLALSRILVLLAPGFWPGFWPC